MKTCSVIGYKIPDFPWDYEKDPAREIYLGDIKAMVENAIRDGYDHFVTGAYAGVEMDFAEAVLAAKKTHKQITLDLIVPYKKKYFRNDDKYKKRYNQLLKDANSVKFSSLYFSVTCYKLRNKSILESTDVLYAFYDPEMKGLTYNTIDSARKKNIPVVLYDLTRVGKN